MRRFKIVWVWLAFQSVVVGQLDVGSDGTDGALNPGGPLLIDLAQAASLCDCDGGGVADDPCRWDCPSPVPGAGVYDSDKWAIVFKYSSVNIANGKFVYFWNHPSRAPVVWLVQTDVTVAGAVYVIAGQAANGFCRPDEALCPGPGGFLPGLPSAGPNLPSGGRGPGGGHFADSPYGYAGASFATSGSVSGAAQASPTYGNSELIPLVGGSGGAGTFGLNGGPGGGAILIAADETITVTGNIYGYGNGPVGGSGGGLRLVADTIAGNGTFHFQGQGNPLGGMGRVRLEALSSISGGFTINGIASQATTPNPPVIWPPSDAPSLSVVSVGYVDLVGQPQTVPVPSDPRARFDFPNADVPMLTDQSITLNIVASNVPLNWVVTARLVPKSGPPIVVSANPLTGTLQNSTTTATVMAPNGFAAVQLRAAQP